ncbi:hypothetical protein RvY_18440 [Ramazzottius varieornatus]|uniref:Large ribosomal subunit protein bL35m n=1 Tax=Ramazzottius varieornatus TaxID=947166 RepID=A0A1D1W5R1_RAMVA|nr:hypothetical protein RvY_18440 [Ramazzottius varieornatus]
MLRSLTSRIGSSLIGTAKPPSVPCTLIATSPKLWTKCPSSRMLSAGSPALPIACSLFAALSPSSSCVLRTSTAVKSPLLVPSRTFIKFDDKEGRKISDPDVLERFYRLTWGGWIKKKMGSNKRVWKMSHRRYRRKDQHVLVSKRYSKMFDRMVTQYYRQPTYFINDPYEPYNKRHDLTHPYYEDKNDVSQRKMFFPEINPAVLAKRKALDATQQFSPTYL